MPGAFSWVFLLILHLSLFAKGQDEEFLVVGNTTNGQTIYLSTYPMTWLNAHWYCKWKMGNRKLAPIESQEETNLLREFIEQTYGPNPELEIFWTAGTGLGGDLPIDASGLKWSTNGKPYSQWGYTNWSGRQQPGFGSPYDAGNGKLCIGAGYRLAPGASGDYTFSWSIENCLEERRFICKTVEL